VGKYRLLTGRTRTSTGTDERAYKSSRKNAGKRDGAGLD
jgi:predicted Ser/Thr protein kinase